MHRARLSANGRRAVRALAAVAAVATILAVGPRLAGQVARTGWTVVAWNNLGMHCMDADFSVFTILPPYNTIQAQVLDASGHLVKTGSGISVSYQAIADPSKSINTTSDGKTNFWQYAASLFGPLGAQLAVDTGLTPVGFVPAKVRQKMPGTTNTPQPMQFDSRFNWYIAEGIPITPYDDGGLKNYYPMMRVTAKNGSTVLATTDIVLPVSDEMDCRACHGSGSGPAARPAAGWENDPNPQFDYRWNILRLHDERQRGNAAYTSALEANGYGANLYDTAKGGKPILCAACHLSEALGGGGVAGIKPLTSAIHTLHAGVIDPTNGATLGSDANRGACYRCHPGSETRCLRGAMGNAAVVTTENGAYSASNIQCQNCHGAMAAVGDPARTGWFQEPACQSCHTGTATLNAGKIRYTSVFEADPIKINPTFATSANAPVAGVSLYRFSSGHGGLQCSACHGSTHAEYPSSHANDNVQSVALQGHVGTIVECGTCHTAGVPMTANGGPHGMHPVGSSWVSGHHDYINGNLGQCQVCHGTDYRGTELSRSAASRTFTTELGTRKVFRGATVGCYMCHNGPFSSNATSNHPPVVSNVSASATSGTPVSIPLVASDADGNTALTYRIVGQPANGAAVLPDPKNAVAVYKAPAGWSGTETFTYTASDGWVDSESVGTVTVSVTAPPTPCTVTATASAPTSGTAGIAVQFTSTVTPEGSCSGGVSYKWSFGDGGTSTVQNPTHTYQTAGTFPWTLTATVGGVTATRSGSITVSGSTTTCTVTATATVPARAKVGTAVSFSSTVSATGCSGAVTYDWVFGDGTADATTQNANHVYGSTGTYTWKLLVNAGGVAATPRSGNITISTKRQNR